MMKSLEKIIWHLDEPIGDPAAVPTYFLSKKAKEKVTVILTGEGGDEAFAGYRTYKLLAAGDYVRKFIPSLVKDSMMPYAIANLPGFTRAKRYLKYVSAKDGEKVYLGQGHILDEEERSDFYLPDFKRQIGAADSLDGMRGYFKAKTVPTFLSQLQYVDIKTWVPEDLLMKLDKTSMAHAIEGRVPLLDHRLLEYTMSLPTGLKLRGHTEKYILKKLMAGRLPKTILTRKKQGFRVPMHHWMLDELSDYANDILSEKSMKSRGLIRPEQAKKLLNSPRNLWRGHQIWGLMNLELWARMYVDGERPKRI
jgi:asparagine synthase (glutamine-hydrolysing)